MKDKMMDLGRKIPKGPVEAKAPGTTDGKSYPYLSLDKLTPGIKSLKPGQTITAKMKLRMNSMSIRKEHDGEHASASFDVVAMTDGTPHESSAEELMDKHMDGDKPNLQGMIGEELDKAEAKNKNKKAKHA